jgi:hypothetical protein
MRGGLVAYFSWRDRDRDGIHRRRRSARWLRIRWRRMLNPAWNNM